MSRATEIHLDADEWSNILNALKTERGAAHESDVLYKNYLTSIISKLEAAGIE